MRGAADQLFLATMLLRQSFPKAISAHMMVLSAFYTGLLARCWFVKVSRASLNIYFSDNVERKRYGPTSVPISHFIFFFSFIYWVVFCGRGPRLQTLRFIYTLQGNA